MASDVLEVELLTRQSLSQSRVYTYSMGKHRGALVLIVLMLCLVGGWWLLARSTDSSQISVAQTTLSVHTPVEVHHIQNGRTHQYMGTTTISGGCATLASGISSTGENPPHVVLLLDTHASSDCPHSRASEQLPFSISLDTAAAEIPVFGGILSNGAPLSFTLIEDTP